MRPDSLEDRQPSRGRTDTGQAVHGIPGVAGRWQPTRAGVVNSWKWTDEVFHFADGWLAFIGRNGSGKSLTASQLVTVLLDGDTSQTALSVSGRAAGTLLTRHTDNRDKEDKTGVWWLEYGRTDPSTDLTDYVTTGLWLRSSGQSLQRAFFIVAGRVGDQLTLQTERTVGGVERLAEQLAAHGGELFTDTARLKSKAGAHLSAISPEVAYRSAVRTRLFAPLDEVQYDALLSVLRTLRSVRTAEKISARDMLEVLTGALPALDQGKLSDIASAMNRIATLERQLADTKDQARKLGDVDRVYALYRQAVASTAALELRSADRELDDLTRSERKANEELTTAETHSGQARHALNEAKLEVSGLTGELSAVDAALRKHAGADLPHRERRATDLAEAAAGAEARAEEGAGDAADADEQAKRTKRDAGDAQKSLDNIAQELGVTARELRGDSALSSLLAASAEVTGPGWFAAGRPHPDVPIDALAAIPLAWVDSRRASVKRVASALKEVHVANQLAIQASAHLRATQDEAERCENTVAEAALTRSEVENLLALSVAGWERSATLFASVPQHLWEPDPVAERVSPEPFRSWLANEVTEIRDRVDVPGHRARHDAAVRGSTQASKIAGARKQEADDAQSVVDGTQLQYDNHFAEAEAAAVRDSERRTLAENKQASAVQAAREDLHGHLVVQLDSVEKALGALTAWCGRVEQWRSALRHLDGSGLSPRPLVEAESELRRARTDARSTLLDRTSAAVRVAEQSLGSLIDYDDGHLRAAVAEAATAAFARLDRRIDASERAVEGLRARADEVGAKLEEARRAPSPPPAPPWRTRTDGDPLWSLVDFRAGAHPDRRNRCEGALLASGLLDAVITRDGRARVGDIVLTAGAPVDGPSLADVLTTEPESPIAATTVVNLLRSVALIETPGGTEVRAGVLTAMGPDGYVSSYIGTPARERARRQRIADLETELHTIDGELKRAESELREHVDARRAAGAEQKALPAPTQWMLARGQARKAQLTAQDAERHAAERQSRARSDLQAVLDELAAAKQVRDHELARARNELTTAMALAEQARAAARAALDQAEERAEEAATAEVLLEHALADQALADTQADSFPSLEGLVTAIADEDGAVRALSTARERVVEASDHASAANASSRTAVKGLNRATDLGDGRMLPADQTALDAFENGLTTLAEQISSWKATADRTVRLITDARLAAASAARLGDRAAEQAREAASAREAAVSEQAAVKQLRELHGAAYEELRRKREQVMEAVKAAQAEVEKAREKIGDAEISATRAKTTLENIAPQRERADSLRETCLRQMSRLVEESVAAVDEGIPVDENGRPANLTAALTWGSRLLATASDSQSRDLSKLLETRRARLEGEAKKVSAELARFDRQVTLQTIPGTEWRRAVVAAPEAIGGEDLHLTVLTLAQTADQLESDLRDDVKTTLKTSMFTALRRDIAVRRAAAEQLVRQIRKSLAGVRTGVARVGVEVDWKVKRDPDAQRMIELVSALPSDETFEQMYEVLRQRLEDASGDTWEARVMHTFDYRVWHEWDIKVTHASFGDGSTEVFKPLTPRSNPLASFSTGEMRLATMLPLLAAAWSMYQAGEYQGPRLLFIDEVNAAFDPQNVRKLLALLREWHFDVLSTAPEMSAVLKAESERVMIAQVTHSGAVRVSMPWLWTGSGQPVLIEDPRGVIGA